MLFPENMLRVEIIADKRRLNNVVKKIVKLGSFQPEEPRSPIGEGRLEDARRKLGVLQEQLNKIKSIMDISKITVQPSGSIKVKDWLETSDEVSLLASKLEERYKDLLEEINKLRAERDLLAEQMKQIEPFKDIDVPLSDAYNMNFFDILLAITNKEKAEELKSEAKNVYFWSYPLNEKEEAILVIGLKKDQIVEKAKRIGIQKLELEEGKAPAAIYVETKRKVDKITELISKRREELSRSAKEDQKEFTTIYGKMLTVISALTIMSRVKVSEFFVQLEGYVPEKDFKKYVEELKDEAHVSSERPKRFGEKEEPPVYIRMPKSISALESVVEIYGTPSYWEISPTVFLVITFPILFGLMFPDLGDAIVVFLFSVWFYKYGKRKGSDNIPKLSLVLIYSSVVAMITGLLARDFFGPLPVGGLREIFGSPKYSVGPLYSVWPVPPSVDKALSFLLPFGEFATNASIDYAIIFSIMLGAILLFASGLLGLVNAIRKKDKDFLLFEKLPTFLIYIVPLVIFMWGLPNLPSTTGFFNADESILGEVLNALLLKPISSNLAGYIIIWYTAFTLLFNWASKAILLKRYENASTGGSLIFGFIDGGFEGGLLLLSNTISFVRILVFALAHYYILDAFSFMAYFASEPFVGATTSTISVLINPLGIVLLVIGNLLAIGLEGLIVFIQDMRLHFYEMFSKFYEGKGKKFEPAVAYVSLE